MNDRKADGWVRWLAVATVVAWLVAAGAGWVDRRLTAADQRLADAQALVDSAQAVVAPYRQLLDEWDARGCVWWFPEGGGQVVTRNRGGNGG